MSGSPTVTQQYAFAVGEDNKTGGDIEPAEESVETSLEAFGADVDHRERDTRIDQPEASSFGLDDRKTVTRGDGGEQRALFADTDDDQRTLTGKRAANQCLFESDDGDDRTGEPTDTASAEASPRAVATDGGRVEDDTDNPDASADSEDDTENVETTFDPYQHVPDEIDRITADGIEQIHDHLSDENAALYAASSVEEQAAFLWKMVDRDVINLSIDGR
jgi:hypothetical protein